MVTTTHLKILSRLSRAVLSCALIALAFGWSNASVEAQPQLQLSSLQLRDRWDYIGIISGQQAIFVQDEVKTGKILWVNLSTGQVSKYLQVKDVNLSEVTISSDGKSFLTQENIEHRPRKDDYVHHLQVRNSSNFALMKQFDIGAEKNIAQMFPRAFSNSSSSGRVALSANAVVWSKEMNNYVLAGERIEIWNVKSGRRERLVPYKHATGLEDLQFSSDGKRIACVFLNREEKYDNSGILDILDAKNGKILWHIAGYNKQPVGWPYFFISPTRFVCSQAIYDLSTKKTQPLKVAGKGAKCVGNVPQRPTRALFQTARGLELWDIFSHRAIHRWPQIKKSDAATFSPDAKVMAVESGTTMQFWKFDPKWLK